MGTSACSGSDKQTLLPPLPRATATTSPNWQRHWRRWGDGSRHRLCRSGRFSAHLGGLQYLGLELPEDRYGAILVIKPTMTKPGVQPRVGRVPQVNGESAVGRSTAPRHSSVDRATVIKLLHQRDENGEDRVAGQSSRPVIAPITHGGWQL